MEHKKQNPGVQARASRNQLVRWLPNPLTPSERQAQLLASRFCLSQSLARDMARLCYGETAND